ncbi:DUF3800 domain-containing protein [Azospirillum canadense]|uniref:DUF3800 domain-containing protein n=1 Tax=Azospirillum canadense TaxID=403962 RepID=UPI002225FB04|nr:DUF3800 domain-containing protein [Azospirillum canadense]
MHIFCDESGGTGRDDSLFLVAAVALSADEATRIMKKFRKATGLRGEVKGSRLTDKHRKIFFDLLDRSPWPQASVVFCRGLDQIGSWALAALDDHELWAELVIESTLWLGERSTIAISADRRYNGARQHGVHDSIVAGLSGRTRANRVTVQFVDSQASDGVQIADIIANTAYRDIPTLWIGEKSERSSTTAKIAIRPVELKARRPQWLELEAS